MSRHTSLQISKIFGYSLLIINPVFLIWFVDINISKNFGIETILSSTFFWFVILTTIGGFFSGIVFLKSKLIKTMIDGEVEQRE